MKASTGSSIALLAAVALFAAILGCGGGGGGGTNTGTNTNTNSTNTTTTTTASTTNAGSTGSQGDLPTDVILFAENDGTTVTIKQMNPDGTGVSTFDTLPTNYAGYAPSPADNRVAFGYSPTGINNPSFEIMVNTSVNHNGATVVDAGPYIYVSSLQFSPDGSKLIYVAQGNSGSSSLFIANSDGSGSPTRLDGADDAFLSPSGAVVVYTKLFSNGEICRIKTDGSEFFRITNNNSEDLLPQWSKEGDRIYFTSDRSGNFNIWSMDPDGGSLQHVTTATDDEYGSTPNTGNTQIAFTRLAGNPANTGIYRCTPTGGSETPLFLASDIDAFVYWTGTNGRGLGSETFGWSTLSRRDRAILHRRHRGAGGIPLEGGAKSSARTIVAPYKSS